MKKYISFLLILSGISAAVVSQLNDSPAGITKLRWCLVAYFFIVTLAFHFGIVKSSKGKPQVFVRYFMGATVFKLLLHMCVIVFYSFSNKQMAVPFIMSFMVFYALYTALEVYFTFKQR